VTTLNPKKGSLNGGTRIVIDGSGFARDQFNFGEGNENIGNMVTFVSSTQTYPCEIEQDGSHEQQLMCYTVPMPEDNYYVRISVDGVDVPENKHCPNNMDNCKFRPESDYTPTITGISPRSGKPGAKIQIRGRLISDRYGSNIPFSSNGLSQKILRVYLGGQTCELKNLETDEFYGLALDNEGRSWNGEMNCKTDGTFIGHMNASFLVEDYGRSLPDPDVLKISSTDKIHMYQTYTGISSISHATGSKNGGLLLTINGKHFDETTAPVKVMVGETECIVQGEIQDEQIVCEVAQEPDRNSKHYKILPGGRGLVHHIWNETSKNSDNLEEVLDLTSDAEDHSSSIIDQMEYSSTDKFNYVDSIEGFFIPPKTTDYIFYIMVDDQAKLYLSTDENPANKSLIAESTFINGRYTYFSRSQQASELIPLIKGKSYYIQTIMRQVYGPSFIKVAARTLESDFTDETSGMVWMEKQKIVVNSIVTKDVIVSSTLNITQPASTYPAVSEVQTVIVDGPGECTFRLGLYGAYTGIIIFSIRETNFRKTLLLHQVLSEALEAIPGLSPDTVTVTNTPTDAGASIVVTFQSDKGDLPELSYLISEEFVNLTTISVSETTKGVSSLEKFQFIMDETPSPAISTTATAAEVEAALISMFSVQCPAVLGNPTGTTFFQDYEGGFSGNFGSPVANIEPFCGRRSARNPYFVFYKGGNDKNVLGKPISQFKAVNLLCMAYKGYLTSIRLRYSYEDGAGVIRRAAATWRISAETPDEWVFSCYDMLDIVKAQRPDGTDYRADWITVSRATDTDLYVDSVSLARDLLSTDPDVSKQRMSPAKPNGALIRDVDVTSSSEGVYEITLDPYECGYDFPLLQIAHAQMTSGSVDKNSSEAVFGICNGASCMEASLNRTSMASVPIEGSFTVSFKGETSRAILPTSTAKQVTEELEALAEFGDLEVTKSGDCANFGFEIKFLSKGGDQPEISVNGSLLTGSNVTSEVQQIQDGGQWYDTIPGDLLRTMHDKPQVQVYINNLPTTCDGDCSFEWTTESTPQIISVNPTSGTLALGTSIDVQGSGFDETMSNNKVMIGGVACTPTYTNETHITCDVGNGPTGIHEIKVMIAGKGWASGSVTFEYLSAITNVAPAIGSIGGGTVITLTGYGFIDTSTVTVDGADCPVSSLEPGQIVCTTPQAATTAGGLVDVLVDQESSSLTSPTQFNYDASSTSTPVITSVSRYTSVIEGGETIIISGTGFGGAETSSEALMIGEKYAVIVSYSDTEINATLPSNRPGSYPLQLSVGILGLADLRINNISNIMYTLQITNIYPAQGSLYGGTRVTITGAGFTTDTSLIDIKFGPFGCAVESATTSSIVCLIEDTGIVHEITNTGKHPVHGYGYAWEPKHLDVKVGDKVRWIWSYAKFINGVKSSITQTVNASTTEAVEGGFSSGMRVKNGVFEHQVTTAGRVDYWSGYVDDFDIIYYRGTLQVDSLMSHHKQLVLTIAGHEAQYLPGGPDPASSEECPGTVSEIPDCSDAAPAPSDASTFHFKFWSCLSPSVTNMDLNVGTGDDEIILSGSGFGSNACENEIKLGSYGGLQENVTSSSLTFKVDPASEMPIGVRQKLSLRVNNLGNALIDLTNASSAKDFALLPSSSGLSPLVGSVNGGTKMVISGSGFQGSTSDVSVTVDVYQCEVLSVMYNEIVCSTPALSEGVYNVSAIISVNGSPFPVSCTGCIFEYSESSTPNVTDVNNTVVNGPTTLTITGSMFNGSMVTVMIADEICAVTSFSDTEIVCNINGLPNGNHPLEVYIGGKGKATSSIMISSPADITSIAPAIGSIHGGLDITIAGNGFTTIDDTSVMINSQPCPLKSVSVSMIVCTTPANSEMTAAVAVTSNSQVYTVSQTFAYANNKSVAITEISPVSGFAGDSVTITGTGFNGDQSKNSVSFNGVECTVTASSLTSITCTLGNVAAGPHSVIVMNSDTGLSDDDTTFTYQMIASSLSHISGSVAGGQTLTITGSGFVTASMVVTICGEACALDLEASQTSSSYVCITPPSTTVVSLNKQCDVVVQQDAITQTLSYSYDNAITPEITGVSPSRGGTAGGTRLTITGTGFGSISADMSVTIDGYVCPVESVNETQIVCITGAGKSSDTKVNIVFAEIGNAKQTSAAFYYIDVWSSQYTWGNNPPPVAGDLVVIPANQTILLDTDTPVLKMLIIQGGKLIFDEKDVEFRAEYILIVDGGVLEVGTEEKPFEHKGIITLFGHQRSKELPIYGAKCLAVREGTLDLHGRPTHVTWTRLSATADVGATELQLQVPVEWQVGDYIVIATTGHRHSQRETEKRQITAISADKLTLTLDQALEYKHLGISETFAGQQVDFRAEVGLLTHNVVVRGSRLTSWEETIEACPDGFDTGEFATQTCFQGRFGEEMGSDQFGAQIIMHPPRRDEDLVIGRLSYIEVNYAGQAFRLGRYPVHFHLNGVMSKSYVRGLGIHETFNRAVNVHNTHDLLIEHTVIYNIMGGSFFLEDGIEHGNIFQYNCALFTRSSSSLLNDDVTPAAFWATNPNNTFRHNVAAGGTHFGFWYRMEDHPTGPSKTFSVCPKHVPVAEFRNNTVHSQGWFGLWIFPDYFPRVDGSCSKSAATTPAVFESLFAWNNEKGAEFVNFGAAQLKDAILVNNEFAGFEGKLVKESPQYSDEGALLSGGLIVGKSDNLDIEKGTCTTGGTVLPYNNGFHVKDVTFANFASSDCSAFRFTSIDGTCTDKCGGFSYKVSGLNFENADRKVLWRWLHEGSITDLDGSLAGQAGYSLVPSMDTLDPAKCSYHAESSLGSINGSLCHSDIKFHRFAFNNIRPTSLEGKEVNMTNEFGSVTAPFMTKRISHKPGWVIILPGEQSYKFEFVNGEQLTNTSFTGVFYQFENSEAIIMSQKVDKKPDRFIIDGSTPRVQSETALNVASNIDGDWKYDSVERTVSYVVSGNKGESRKKRAVITTSDDRNYNLKIIKCYYKDCIPPPDVLDVFTTPNVTYNWSDPVTWEELDRPKPVEGDDVTIPRDFWIIMDESPPKLGKLNVEGGLEFQNDAASDLVLEADLIYIKGRFVVGWDHTLFEGKAEIILHGNQSVPAYPVSDGPALGSTFIAVFGGLEAHGLDHGVQWTRLSETANAGGNQIKLQEAVTWAVGDEIVIAPTSYSVWHTETFTITAVSADMMTLTLNSSLAFNHIGELVVYIYSETLATGQSYTLAAEVGHLTRNIKIRGAQYPAMEDESFGARLVVGRTAESTKSYVGFARISNVEFVNTGQEGFTDSYDPRFSVSFMDVVMKPGMPSYIKMSAFHNGFSPAIGVFGTNDLLVEKNIVHRTVESGIISNSARTSIKGNLLLLNQWSGSYQDRFETKNIRYQGSIELIDAITPILIDNVVAGSERIGYHVLGESCSGSGVEAWSGNQAHTSLIGVGILPTDPTLSASCVQFSNFMVWKNGDFGIYYNSERSVEVKGVVAADNQVGIFTFVVGPSAVGHVFGDKMAAIEDTLVIGHTPSFDCAVDRLDPTDANVELSEQGRSFGNGTGGVVGMSTTTFNQGSNNAPEKKFINIMAYNSINGLMTIDNVTFARFAQYCSTDYDYCITTNPSNDDAHHPTETSNLRFTQVGEDNKIYFHIPSVSKINSADCVDMDCDGLKKNLITDIDGSLLGTNGTVIAWSEYQWDGDRRRGLGDYRIPNVLLSDGNGDLRDVSAFAPNKGLIRNDQCIFHDYWRAYECHDIEHKILIIENMDEDTELRRISPVAVLSEGYLDLINGPQDHGWCSGYTCRKRISTFQAMTAIDKFHDIYFTGTTPQHLRFYLLDTESTQGIRVGVWYATPNRLDVHVNGQYVVPNNGEMKDGRLVLKPSSTSVEFMPAVSQPSGSNYVKRDENMMFFVIKGSDRIDITLASVVVVSFSLPEMTIDEFFGENLIQNMAAFLGVDPRKVRIVDVVREDSGSRRKRQTGSIKLIIEIGDEPDDPNPLPFATLEKASEAIAVEAQAGSFDTIVNATVLGVSTIEPTPPLTDPNWANATKEVVEREVVKVDSMEFLEPVVPGIEQQIMATAPRIEVFDVNVSIAHFRISICNIHLLLYNFCSNPSARLNGMKTLTFVDGWANFTDLSISHPGTGYIVDFKVTSPAGASNMVLSTPNLTVAARDVSFDMVSIANSEEDRQNLTVILELLDMDQESVLSDISWRVSFHMFFFYIWKT
ncbi:hypothetical protein LOTGIDRAFT_131466, partial [Lottia gigantea]